MAKHHKLCPLFFYFLYCDITYQLCLFVLLFFVQITDLKGLSIDHLIPGMMISARVHSVLENGVMLSFLTYFSGTVSAFLTVYFFFL
jgi:hypothetical protein